MTLNSIYAKLIGFTMNFSINMSWFEKKTLTIKNFGHATNKRTVSIKRTVLTFFKKFLLNVPYDLKIGCLNGLTYRTYNRKHRVVNLSNILWKCQKIIGKFFENFILTNVKEPYFKYCNLAIIRRPYIYF